MFMFAIVDRVMPGRLLVTDRRTRRRVVVLTHQTRCIFPGDIISILFSGVMTRSNPPQISAIAIRRISPRRSC